MSTFGANLGAFRPAGTQTLVHTQGHVYGDDRANSADRVHPIRQRSEAHALKIFNARAAAWRAEVSSGPHAAHLGNQDRPALARVHGPQWSQL